MEVARGDSSQHLASAENGSAAAALPMMTQEEKDQAWAQFEAIIYSNLDGILEKRPAFPVTKFAKAILEDVNLDENGDPILKKKKKKDKKKKDKKHRRTPVEGEEEKVDEEAVEESPKKKKKDKKKKDKDDEWFFWV